MEMQLYLFYIYLYDMQSCVKRIRLFLLYSDAKETNLCYVTFRYY